MLLCYLQANPHSQLFTGKTITISGGFTTNPFTGTGKVGFISGILQQATPAFMKKFKAPSEKIALLTDRECKVQHIIQTTKTTNITGIAGIPLRASHILKETLAATGKTHLHDVRPHFEVFFTGGTRFEPYREEFDQLWDPKKVQVWQSYNASEGFFAVQMEKNADDMLLLTNHGVFYECIPLSAYHAVRGGTLSTTLEELALPLEKVQLGEEYVLVITTNAGLWRYVIGDTIRFTSLHPYKLQITGRTKFFIDAFNEHTLLDHTEKAIKLTETALDCKVKEYTVGPNVPEKCYEWVIEFFKEPKNLTHFEQVLDANLQQANDNYRAKRVKGGMQPLTVYPAKPGIFEQWFLQQGTSGGQSKVRKLSNDLELVSALKAL